jgi:hypothetical protein
MFCIELILLTPNCLICRSDFLRYEKRLSLAVGLDRIRIMINLGIAFIVKLLRVADVLVGCFEALIAVRTIKFAYHFGQLKRNLQLVCRD